MYIYHLYVRINSYVHSVCLCTVEPLNADTPQIWTLSSVPTVAILPLNKDTLKSARRSQWCPQLVKGLIPYCNYVSISVDLELLQLRMMLCVAYP